MHNPPYNPNGAKRSLLDAAKYQQDRAAQLYSIARTFLFNGNSREARRFQEQAAATAAGARELLGIA